MKRNSIIDPDRYPIYDRNTDRYQALIAQARDRLGVDGALELPGFLQGQAVVEMRDTALGLKSQSHHMSGNFPAYSDALGDDDDLSLPADHPSRIRLPASHRFVPGDVIADDSLVTQLYRDQCFVHFLEDVLGVAPLYPLADPLGRINLLIYESGDCNGWHFDTNGFVISLALQAAERGGHYQYYPGLRSDSDPNLDAVSHRMRNPDDVSNASTATLAPGTLFLFRGKHTLHRVTEIGGNRPRVVAILSYHTSPDHWLSDSSKLAMYGRAC